MAWSVGLRMLQPSLRAKIKTLLHIAAEALERIDSPLTHLRALLHLEMTKCELAAELVKTGEVKAGGKGWRLHKMPLHPLGYRILSC